MQMNDCQRYNEIVSSYTTSVYQYLYSRRLPGSEVEELVQETFLQVWKALPTYEEQGSQKAWILAICRNVLGKHRRRKGFEVVDTVNVLEQVSADYDGQHLLEDWKRYQWLKEQIKSLSEKHQEILHLHYLQELSETEAAQLLDLPKETVRSRLRTARKKLRERCQKSEVFSHE